MKTDILVYDHDTTPERKSELLQILDGLASVITKGRTQEENVIDELKEKQLVIGHFGDDKLWESLLDTSPFGSIRIRTSTVGRYGNPHRVTNRNVIELNLYPKHSNLDKSDWEIILTEISKSGVALRIAEGDCPNELHTYFGTSIPEILTALSILCQGFLMILKPIQGKNVEGEKKEIFKKAFSNVFGDKNTEEVRRIAEGEWETFDPKADFGPVETLFKSIESTEVINYDMVKKAYEELSKRLGAISGT